MCDASRYPKVVKFDSRNWIEQPDMNKPRFGAAATFFNNDLYLFGGEEEGDSNWNFVKS